MRLEKCYFCSATCWPGHGITFVRNDSRIFKFCRSKCHAAFKRKKNPRKTRWTKAYRKSTGKELTNDPVLALEAKRHVPQKYSRELWAKTVEKMKLIKEIREAREGLHIKTRLRKGQEVRLAADKRNVEKNIALVRSPAAPVHVTTKDLLLAKKRKAAASKAAAKAKSASRRRAVVVEEAESSEEEAVPMEN